MPVSFEWTPEEQREYALAKLLKHIESDIYPFHPHYRGVFEETGLSPGKIQSYRDFTQFPITEKVDIQQDPGAFCLQPKMNGNEYDTTELPRSKQLKYFLESITTKRIRDYYGPKRTVGERYKHTYSGDWEPIHYQMGGRGGSERITVYYTYSDIKRIIPSLAGMVYFFGFEPSMKVLNLFPAFQHVSFFQMLFTEFFLDNGISIFNTCGEGAIPLARQVRIAGSIPFDLYISTPSFMNTWLKRAISMIDDGETSKPEPVKFAVLAGENLSDESRMRVHDMFSKIGSPEVKIIQGYGSAELKSAFFECGEESGFHLNPEFYFWEVLDPDSRKPVKWGEPGVLVFSHIGWHGTALLRFWTGDYVEGGVTWRKCKVCGHTMPIAHAPIRRLDY